MSVDNKCYFFIFIYTFDVLISFLIFESDLLLKQLVMYFKMPDVRSARYPPKIHFIVFSLY